MNNYLIIRYYMTAYDVVCRGRQGQLWESAAESLEYTISDNFVLSLNNHGSNFKDFCDWEASVH